MDFDTKKAIFRSEIDRGHNSYRKDLRLKLKRSNIFQGSFVQLMLKPTDELRGSLYIEYEDEFGQDAGGLTRDWFQTISQEIFNRDYALFNLSTSGNTYQPSSLSYVNGEHLQYFKFVGRVIGKALFEDQLIGAYFTRSFYKLILGEDLQLKDL